MLGMDQIIIKFVGKIITGLKLAAASIFGRVMGGVGLTFANFQYVLPEVKSFIESKMSGLPEQVLTFLGACGVDIFIVIVVSAVVARAGMRTILTSLNSVQGLLGQEQGS